MKKELSKYDVTAYWWNMRSKTLDFSGNLYDLLIKKGISIKKVKDKTRPELDCYVFSTRNRISYKCYGDIFDGAFTAIKLHYAYMGDKAMVNVCGRSFTINH